MMEESDLLIALCEVEYDQGRHHETLNAQWGRFLLAVEAGLLAFWMSVRFPSGAADWPISLQASGPVLLVLVSAYGFITSLKYTERSLTSYDTATRIRDVLVADSSPRFQAIVLAANKQRKRRFGWIARQSLFKYVAGFHLMMAFIGVLLLGEVLVLLK